MKIDIKKLPKSKIEVQIEVPAEEFGGFIDKAVFNLGKDIEVKGFRRGSAPKEMVIREAGLGRVLDEAAEICIRENYLRTILENKLETLGRPEIQILKIAPGNPFVFRATTAVVPEVELPDYKKIASQIKKNNVSVEEKELAEALRWLQENHSRSAQGKEEEKEELPEINDQWARGLGKFENLEALKKSLKEGLATEKELAESQRVRREIIEKIAQDSKLELPEILVEEESRRIIESMKRGIDQILKISFDEYLKKINKTEKDFLESSLKEAEKNVRNSLVLREISKKEGIAVSEGEASEEINKILRRYPNTKEAEKNIDLEKLKIYIENELRNEKTLAKLEGLASVPEL